MSSASVFIVIAATIMLSMALFILEAAPGSIPFIVFFGLILLFTVVLESVLSLFWRYFSELRRF
ncbi:MAG: hypothetical protein FJ118_14055 [Deltaproteobacteria bacterium]|nr:hypothetical protein [Deltaproteobacteria bacterium]